jgi:AraC-like DNA-binding protein
VLSGRFGGVRQCGEPESGGAAPGGTAELFVGINVAGDSLARQQRREVGIGAGDAVVIDPGGGSFTVLRPGPCRLIGLRVPWHAVPSACGAGQPPLRLVPADTAALQLLTRYLGSILAGPPPSGRLTDAMVAHLTELIELSLLTPGSGALPALDRGVRAARLAAIKADIGRHLTDGSLSAPALAARHGITPRYLHKLFEDDAMTYSHYVLEQRLALACRRLHDPAWPTVRSARSPTTPASATCRISTGRSAAGTASRRRMPASQLRADHLGCDVADVDHYPGRGGLRCRAAAGRPGRSGRSS